MKKIFNFQFSITRHPGLLRRFSKAPSGFTLIESFVAITILVTAIAGPLSIASNSLRAALVASNQVSASFLAQEAIEYIRYTRDSNRLSGNAWTTYLNNCISANGSQACYIDATKSASVSGAINACTGGVCPQIMYDSSSGFYNYNAPSSTNAPSEFTRTITITQPACNASGTSCNNDELSIQSTVSWMVGAVPHSFTVHENLLRWQ